MNISRLFSLLFGILLIPVCDVLASDAEVTLWGSTTCEKRFLVPGAEALEKATGIKIKVFGVGTGKGVLALLQGKTKVALSSNTLEESIKLAQTVRKEANLPPIEVPAGLQYHKIIDDTIVCIVHENNPISELTWKKLAGLLNGKIVNWKELGGPD